MGGDEGKGGTDNWLWVKHSEIALINPKKPALDDDEVVSFVPMAAVPAEVGFATVEEERVFSQVKQGYTAFQDGDILFAKITPCMENGKVALARGLRSGIGFGSTEFHVSRLHSDLCEEFYLHFLMSHQFRAEAQRNMSGSAGQLRVPKQYFADVELPLPPLNEQHRIVAKIEELFSELDKGVESLKTARAQLKTYRQSLLKAAFEGRLTEQWRRDNANKLETAEQLVQHIRQEREVRYQRQLEESKEAVEKWKKNGKLGRKPGEPSQQSMDFPGKPKGWSKPAGWLCLSIGWLLSAKKKGMTTGPFGTMLKKAEHRASGVPVLGVENIGEGFFRPGAKIHVEPKKADELAAFEVDSGDVLVSRSGTVGEVCRVPDGVGHALISTNLMRVSLDEAVIDSRYFVLLFQGGSAVKDQVRDLCKGSTREFLNQKILASIAFPVPPLEEQQVLVDMVQARLSQVDELESAIDCAFNRSEALRQSILKRAFEGKLVPQDPDDEPASVLLERIRQEQVDAPKAKRHKRKTETPA